MRRKSSEVVVRAIIYGSLGFRASLEVTQHARAATLCSQLWPWLEQLNFGAQIEEFHREILETPHGELPRDSQTEAYWRGEAASLLGWAVQLLDQPHPSLRVDPGVLVQNLRILQPNVSELLSDSSLRSQLEIDEYCTFCLTVRHRFQLSVLAEDGQSILERIHQSRMDELGLTEASLRLNGSDLESLLGSTPPGAQGLYVIRALTAEWLLGADE